MIYRLEHPNPQFMRGGWTNLNGEWQFVIDHSNSGEDRRFFEQGQVFPMKINVPFCPESKLSGIEHKDFMNSVWYKRDFHITDVQLQGRVLLHFGAADYETIVYINGCKCGTHKGGYSSFSFDITEYLNIGNNTVTVHVVDDTRDTLIPTGKQSDCYQSQGCFYTRTTGIWQTVWLEYLPKTYIKNVKYFSDIENGVLNITAELVGSGMFQANAYYNEEAMGNASVYSHGGVVFLSIKLKEIHLWEVGNGRLYDLELFYDEDFVQSYFGMRSLQLDGYKFLINGKSVFQRLVLDQGYYPDGIYTAPCDDEFREDIKRAQAMGFNGARLHEKIFEKRFLYHCDSMGYIVWGEYPNWGLDHSKPESIYSILPEWLEEIERDYNHPSIVGWCPFNETFDQKGRKQIDELIELVYKTTKVVDPTRPCIDTSGHFHVLSDIFDVHNYEQEPKKFAAAYNTLPDTIQDVYDNRQTYRVGQPIFVSEYGGAAWNAEVDGWGHGTPPASLKEFLDRLKGLTDAIIDNKYMFGFCYTQFTDVEQEQNGLYTYERKPKFDPEIIYKIISRKAAIEEEI